MCAMSALLELSRAERLSESYDLHVSRSGVHDDSRIDGQNRSILLVSIALVGTALAESVPIAKTFEGADRDLGPAI